MPAHFSKAIPICLRDRRIQRRRSQHHFLRRNQQPPRFRDLRAITCRRRIQQSTADWGDPEVGSITAIVKPSRSSLQQLPHLPTPNLDFV